MLNGNSGIQINLLYPEPVETGITRTLAAGQAVESGLLNHLSSICH